jgi:iron complex outermembrane receptor protein
MLLFRIDNVVLGWSFKEVHKVFKGGRIYATVQNPFVFTKYKGLDPEVFGGIDNNVYPRPLTLMLGTNLNF